MAYLQKRKDGSPIIDGGKIVTTRTAKITAFLTVDARELNIFGFFALAQSGKDITSTRQVLVSAHGLSGANRRKRGASLLRAWLRYGWLHRHGSTKSISHRGLIRAEAHHRP
jgi:hypothetical protein